MAEELERQAIEAFKEDEFEQAADLYTQAIRLDPSNAGFYVDRAWANIKLENYTDAVADANRAIELDSSLAKAYLRKGIACFSLEEYQTAMAAFKAGSVLDDNNSKFKTWIDKCDAQLVEEAASDGKESESVSPAAANGPVAPVSDNGLPNVGSEQLTSRDNTNTNNNNLGEPLQPTKPKYRHEYYQKPNEVVVTVFAKGVSKDIVTVEFGEQFLSIIIDVPGEDNYVLQRRLFAKIIPEKCKYSILSTKIEVRLAKAEPINWTSLEYDKKQAVPQKPNIFSGTEVQRTTYPSSNTKARRDWDKLEAQVKKEEKDEKLEGDAALNKLFRDIYQDADEDTRRAMQKSFIESNGTVLSTNWKEVGAKHVDGSPPQGMEMKKWEI